MATATNDITGKALRSSPPSDKYAEGWERIFGKKEEEVLHTCPYKEDVCGDYETLCDCSEEQEMTCRMDI